MDKTTLYAKAFLESIRGIPASKLSPALSRLKALLKQKEESRLYPRILKKVVAFLEYESNAVITSARPMSESLQTQILKKLKKNFPDISDHDIQFEIDEKMIGGVSIAYQDFLFDGTIKTALKKLTK